MASISIEEARARVLLQNPNMSSADVRRAADKLIADLDYLAFEDEARAQFAAQQAEADRQQAIEAQRRAEALADAAGIVAKSHPGWSAESIDRESQRLLAENERAIAEMNLRESLAEGFDRS